MIFVLTGNGKGKTTSAIGMGVRAVGAGGKVLMIQFFKVASSENKVIEKIKNFEIKSFGREGFYIPQAELEKNPQLKKQGVKALGKEDSNLFRQGFNLAEETAAAGEKQLLILDEIMTCLKFKLVAEKEIINFLETYKDKLDIVLTGRDCPPAIIRIADLITEMREKKHPFSKGGKARKGIEF